MVAASKAHSGSLAEDGTELIVRELQTISFQDNCFKPVRRAKPAPMSRRADILEDGLPAFGYARADDICSALSISRSQFWALAKQRGLPSLKVSPRVTLFLSRDVRLVLLGKEGAE